MRAPCGQERTHTQPTLRRRSLHFSDLFCVLLRVARRSNRRVRIDLVFDEEEVTLSFLFCVLERAKLVDTRTVVARVATLRC